MEVSKTFVNGLVSSNCTVNKNFSYISKTTNSLKKELNLNYPKSENLQAYFLTKNPSFGRLQIEHLQNGAYVDEARNVFFKLLTFPNVKKVSVVIAQKVDKGLKNAQNSFKITAHELNRDLSEEAGIFKLKLGPDKVKTGDKYAFEITYSNGEKKLCCDPYAKRKKVFFIDPKKSTDGYLDAEKIYRTDRFAEIYNHNDFKWTDDKWRAGKDKRRVSRLSSQNGLKSIKESRTYEINIPTFTKDGTFDSAITKIDKMIKKGWFKANGEGTYNTIEVMPVETSNAPGWNYDGIFKNAPLEALGGPDGLKRLVNYAHSKGINMIMDSVPNHFGTDYNLFRDVGPYLGKDGDFGPKPNLENDFRDNKHVRDWIVNMCGLNWLRDYHFDGVRLDFTHDIGSDYTLRQLVNEINYHEKHAITIFEDNRVFESERILSKISDSETLIDKPEELHAESIKKYDTNNVALNLGANSRWGYEWEHAINKACSGKISMSDLKNEMIAAVKRGDTLYGARASHDEKGNADGISEITALVRDKLNMFARVNGSNDTDRGQKAAQATQAYIEALVSGQHPSLERNSFFRELYTELSNALDYAIAQNKVSLGLTATLPSPKLRFQGNVEPFYFFRKYAIDTKADWAARKIEKGYAVDESAIKASVIDSIPYSKKYQEIFDKVDAFEKDVNEFAASNKAMKSGYIYEDSTLSHNSSNILGTHLKKDNSEVFTISNFSSFSYNGDYKINLPKGRWKEVINSNALKYAGDGTCLNKSEIISNGSAQQSVSIPKNSFIIFEKIS